MRSLRGRCEWIGKLLGEAFLPFPQLWVVPRFRGIPFTFYKYEQKSGDRNTGEPDAGSAGGALHELYASTAWHIQAFTTSTRTKVAWQSPGLLKHMFQVSTVARDNGRNICMTRICSNAAFTSVVVASRHETPFTVATLQT